MPEIAAIRSPSPEDRDSVVALLAAQLAEHHIDTPPAAIIKAVDGIVADARRGFLLIATEDEKLVGVAYVSTVWTLEHGGESCWLEELYVVPDRRDRGIGARLLSAVLETAKSRGCAAVDLEVDSQHERATKLYSRHGFQRLSRNRWVRSLGEGQR